MARANVPKGPRLSPVFPKARIWPLKSLRAPGVARPGTCGFPRSLQCRPRAGNLPPTMSQIMYQGSQRGTAQWPERLASRSERLGRCTLRSPLRVCLCATAFGGARVLAGVWVPPPFFFVFLRLSLMARNHQQNPAPLEGSAKAPKGQRALSTKSKSGIPPTVLSRSAVV